MINSNKKIKLTPGQHRHLRECRIRLRDDRRAESRGSAGRRPSGLRNVGRACADSQHDQT